MNSGSEQHRWWCIGEVGKERLLQEGEEIAAVLAAGGDGRPNPLAPDTALFTASSLRDAAVDHHVANSLFGGIVGRLKLGYVREPQILGGMFAEAAGQFSRGLSIGRAFDGDAFELFALRDQRGAKGLIRSGIGHRGTRVPELKQGR